MIAIIDYGMGNLRSVQKAVEKCGAQATITQNPDEIKSAEKVILPGVGAMRPAMEKLESLGLIEPIKEAAVSGKPFLGICLGYQLLFEKSIEGGGTPGLGVLKGIVEKFPTHVKIPQIGWNKIQFNGTDNPLWQGVTDGSYVYFCHSYYVTPADESIRSSKTDYGLEFASSVRKDNIFGVQYHPEKSQTVGLKILENFCKL